MTDISGTVEAKLTIGSSRCLNASTFSKTSIYIYKYRTAGSDARQTLLCYKQDAFDFSRNAVDTQESRTRGLCGLEILIVFFLQALGR